MMTLENLLIIVGLGAIFIVLERLMPLDRAQPILRPGWTTDLLHTFLGGAIIGFCLLLTFTAISVLADHAIPPAVGVAMRAQPGWLQFFEILLLSDLGVYAIHRSAHAVPLLWRFHAVHHSGEHMDWAAAHRVHPVEQVLFSTAAVGPAILLGFSPEPLIAYALVYNVWALLLHANVSLDFGPLRHVIGSPRFHHWHHADQREAYDRNFAALFPFYDHLFGTFRMPKDSLPELYGVDEPVPQDFLGQITHPFRRDRRRATAADASPQFNP
ncbi:MAG TPA: sterol desaturase family protein [Brevundimonas sp.]|jgi:sterol desaturase/sphingolipid hydroxylase (fatty acid hydroxylase superfamily)